MNRTKCIINLNNLKYNLNLIRKHTNKKIIGVVKTSAYGHGILPIVRTLEKEAIDYLAVACFKEAVELRDAGIRTPILVMGVTNYNQVEQAALLNITLTVYSLEWLTNLKVNHKLYLHLKIDSGMNRIGLRNIEEVKEAIDIISNNELLEIEGIFTHYATADNDYDYYLKQRDMFKQILDNIDYNFNLIHTSNSAALALYQEDFTNAVRPGLLLYGLKPIPDITLFVKPVLSLYSKVIIINELKPGDKVGYDGYYIADSNERIATISIGYGDGWLRRNEIQRVFINNHYYNVVGRICMDMMMVKVDDNVNVNDQVELIGSHITVAEIAINTNTINYEVITNLGNRLNKEYIEEE